MTMTLSQAMRNGAQGKEKISDGYMKADDFALTGCCALGAAIIGKLGADEAFSFHLHRYTAGKSYLSWIQENFPITLLASQEVTAKLRESLKLLDQEISHPVEPPTLGELIVYANDHSPMSIDTIAGIVEEAEASFDQPGLHQ